MNKDIRINRKLNGSMQLGATPLRKGLKPDRVSAPRSPQPIKNEYEEKTKSPPKRITHIPPPMSNRKQRPLPPSARKNHSRQSSSHSRKREAELKKFEPTYQQSQKKQLKRYNVNSVVMGPSPIPGEEHELTPKLPSGLKP